MPVSQYFNNQGGNREQFLVEDLIIESIKNHGIDIFYLPRTSQSIVDTIYGEDPVKYYDRAYKIDMYLETFNDFEGQQEFFSKFGLQVEKTARVAIARRTFEKYVPTDVRNLPKEGDLVYLPVQRKLMEVRFVEREKNFFQLGKMTPYMYVLSLETFKYNGELINTGYDEIDMVGDESAISINYDLYDSGQTISYSKGEVVWQGGTDVANANAHGIVVKFDRPTATLRLRNIKGTFLTGNGNTVIGSTSGATFNIATYDDLYNATIPAGDIGDNIEIQKEANEILDFSESNPWGDP
jgi:hypothetical protein